MSSLRLSRVPAIDTALKLVAVAVAMFAFVFVVMVPLYNVLCDALGINGKTSSQAYTAVPSGHEVTWRLGAAQYMPSEEMVHPDWVRRADGLTRPEAELIAARVAQLRECFY